MDQSAIRRSRERTARWRDAGELLWALPAALGALVLALQRTEIWTEPPGWLIWVAVVSGTLVVVLEKSAKLLRGPSGPRDGYDSGDRQKFMASCAVEIHERTNISVACLGLSLWVIHSPRRTPWAWLRRRDKESYLWRIERFRASDPPATNAAWPLGRGAIGVCAKTGGQFYRDFRPQQAAYPQSLRSLSKEAWKRICRSRQDDGFEKNMYLEMLHRYEQVLAYPITDGDGRVVGCVSLDVTAPSGDDELVHDRIDSKPVVEAIHRLAGSMARTAHRHASLP